MARPHLRRTVLSIAALGTTIALTATPVYAEEHSDRARKPIYDAPPPFLSPPPATPTSPTPTDRLASSISIARQALNTYHHHLSNRASYAYTKYLTYEDRVARTIAGLAPRDEKIMPGAIYVAVAAMAGGIVVRRRNIVIRGLVPLMVAGITAEMVLPKTLTNVGALVRSWEEKAPAVKEAHDTVEREVSAVVKTVKGSVEETREKIGGWVASAKKEVEQLVKRG